jgi:hypothetical protein
MIRRPLQITAWSLALLGIARAEDRDELIIEWAWLPFDLDWLLGEPWAWLMGALALVVPVALRRRKRRQPGAPVIGFTRLDPDAPLAEADVGQLLAVQIDAPGAEPPCAVTLRNPRTGQSIELMPERLAAGSAIWVTQPVLLHAEAEVPVAADPTAQRIAPPALAGAPGDTLSAACAGAEASLPVAAPAAAGPLCDGIVLSAAGAARVVLDLGAQAEPGITVRLADTLGRPVAGEALLWHMAGYEEALAIVTDDNGLATLSFAAGAAGRCVALVDGLLLADRIPRGSHQITVVPEDELLYPLMASGPVRFSVELRTPTLLAILGGDYKPAVALDPEVQARFQVVLDTADADAAPQQLRGMVTGPGGSVREVTLVRQAASAIYESDVQVLQAAGERGTVTFTCCDRSVAVPWFPDPVSARAGLVRAELEATRREIDAIHDAMAIGDERYLLGLKSKLIGNALQWMAQVQPLWGALAVAIGETYLELLESDAEGLGAICRDPPDRRFLPQMLKHLQIRCWCEGEKTELELTLDAMVRLVQGKFDRFYGEAIIETAKFVLAPQIGAYTAISGRTVEGAKATRLERVLGAVTALAAVAPAGIAVARHLRAARAYERQIARATRIIDGHEAAFERLALHGLGEAVGQGAFAVTAEYAERAIARLAADVERKALKDLRAARLARWLDRRASNLEARLTQARQSLPAARAELDALRANRLALKAKRASTRQIAGRIRSAEARVRKIERDVPELEKRLGDHRAERAALANELDAASVGRYLTGRELQQFERAGVLPGPHDSIEGVAAHRLFELDVDEFLKAQSAQWQYKGKWHIEKSYRTTDWGRRFGVSRKETKAPETPDHIDLDPQSLHGVDSKMYPSWPQRRPAAAAGDARRLIDDRTREVVDTIEKTRLVQYHVLRGQMPGATPTAVWKEVWRRRITIATPVEVPAYFQNIVRASVRGAGRNVDFRVVPIDLRRWAAAIARADARLR